MVNATIRDRGHLSPEALQNLTAMTPDVGAEILLQNSPPHVSRGSGLSAMYQIHPRYGEIDLFTSQMPSYARQLAGTRSMAYWVTLVHATLYATQAFWLATRHPGTDLAAPVGIPAWEQSARPLVDGWVDAVIAKHLAQNPTLWQPRRLGPFFDRRLTAEIGHLQRYIDLAGKTAPCYGRAYGRLRKLYLGSHHVIQLSSRDLAHGLGIDLTHVRETERLIFAIESWGAGTQVANRHGKSTFFTLGDLVMLHAMLGRGSTRPAAVELGCLIRTH